MKVSRAIELLSEINPDEEIAISWWERDRFTDSEDQVVSYDLWSYAVSEFDNNEGYELANERTWGYLNQAIEEAKSEEEQQ
jgi:hypothetical protein